MSAKTIFQNLNWRLNGYSNFETAFFANSNFIFWLINGMTKFQMDKIL